MYSSPYHNHSSGHLIKKMVVLMWVVECLIRHVYHTCMLLRWWNKRFSHKTWSDVHVYKNSLFYSNHLDYERSLVLAKLCIRGNYKACTLFSDLNSWFDPYIGKMGRYFLFCVSCAMLVVVATGDDLNRQSIVFYDETPDVFYCPQEKPVSLQGKIRIVLNLEMFN